GGRRRRPRHGPVAAHDPRVRGARRPGPDHDRAAQRRRPRTAPRLEGHARAARAARVRVQPRSVRRAGAPRPAHGRGRAADGRLPARQGPRMNSRARSLWIGAALLLAALLVLLLGAGVGSTGFDSVLNAHRDPVAWQILWDIRLPRTL